MCDIQYLIVLTNPNKEDIEIYFACQKPTMCVTNNYFTVTIVIVEDHNVTVLRFG